MATKGQKGEGRVGKIFRIRAVENSSVRTLEMVGRLKDGECVLCLEHAAGKGYWYVPVDIGEATIRLYSKAFWFHAGAMGVATTWQPTDDEFRALWAKQTLNGEGKQSHPLVSEVVMKTTVDTPAGPRYGPISPPIPSGVSAHDE